ncbi:protein max-like isoform X1 [Limulus polyphemus]|uniref:Protein max-like isoform X1 n=1 Tax=Limulus polyphemus TaxID=6850 RepID=A0ABM1BIG6_LIMPO|nr:protein max-like isoform X1 [Limulus polyphemus]
MSDEDKDVDVESDDEDTEEGYPFSDESDRGPLKNGSNQFPSQAEKRAHHNALERKRRDHIKDSFSSLRDAVPSLRGEKASRAQILKKAADYIQFMRRKNSSHHQDIDDLKRQNRLLEDQIRSLEKAKATGNFTASTMLDTNHFNSKGDAISAFDGGSGSESSDTEDSGQSHRKKMKISPSSTPA